MAEKDLSDFHRGLLGPQHNKPPIEAMPGAHAITVVAGATETAVRFTVDDLSPDWAFGPAPYPRPAPGLIPPAGTKGVALFSPDAQRCWVVALYGWPTAADTAGGGAAADVARTDAPSSTREGSPADTASAPPP